MKDQRRHSLRRGWVTVAVAVLLLGLAHELRAQATNAASLLAPTITPGESALYLTDDALFVGQIPTTLGYRTESLPIHEVAILEPNFPQPAVPPGDVVPCTGRVSDYKNGFFQKLSLTGTWLYRNGSDTYEMTEFESYLSVALPAPTVNWPLLITPGYNMRLLAGPDTPDLPARLYDTYLQLLWVPKFTDQLSLVLSAKAGLYTDFNALDSDSFRVTGWGVVRYDFIPNQFQFLLGAAYLGRDDFMVVPIGGVIWDPSPDMHFEVVFPKPKLGYRLFTDCVREHWIYTAAEIGGDTWSIEQSPGVHQNLTLSDVRILGGYEVKRNGGARWRAEVGYVFARTIELSGQNEESLNDTLLLRGGIDF